MINVYDLLLHTYEIIHYKYEVIFNTYYFISRSMVVNFQLEWPYTCPVTPFGVTLICLPNFLAAARRPFRTYGTGHGGGLQHRAQTLSCTLLSS